MHLNEDAVNTLSLFAEYLAEVINIFVHRMSFQSTVSTPLHASLPFIDPFSPFQCFVVALFAVISPFHYAWVDKLLSFLNL
jgi:hypothetical protein